jgi:hypothetical protein
MASDAEKRRRTLALSHRRNNGGPPLPPLRHSHDGPCKCGAVLSVYNEGDECGPCRLARP